MDERIEQFIRQMPKAENHYHIDCISADLAWKFSQRNHIPLPYESAEATRTAFRQASTSLDAFFEVSFAAMKTICTKQDFEDMVLDCARDMYEQNILYRDVMFNYTACYQDRSIPLGTVIRGYSEGLLKAKKLYPNADIRFIADLDRTSPAASNIEYLKELEKYRSLLPITAVGIDVKEYGYPASLQKSAYEYAKHAGYRLTGHAGEEIPAGSASIRNLLETCDVDRIDHGIHAAEDPELLAELADRKILCTLCPDSNICLHNYPSWESYPLRTFLNAGVPVSINSDDPPYFRNDLTGNYLKLEEQFSLTPQELETLVLNALVYNFAGKEHIPEIRTWFREHQPR